MKKGIHPRYELVVFRGNAADGGAIVVRRRRKTSVINKRNPRFKARQG